MAMAMAMAGLIKSFGVTIHKIVASGEEGDQSKSTHIQQFIVNIIHHVKEGNQKAKPWISWTYAMSSQAIIL